MSDGISQIEVMQNRGDFVSYKETVRPNLCFWEETQMSNELSVIQAVTNVGQALMSMASSAMSLKTIRKQDAVILEENLHLLKHACRTQGAGEITRLSLNQMDKTLQNIRQKGYTGDELNMAMNMLNIQYQMLCKNLQDYLPS